MYSQSRFHLEELSDLGSSPGLPLTHSMYPDRTKVVIDLVFQLARPVTVIPYAPYQLHLLVFAVFASLVAPFGGFFASGFKRAFNIKDFGHSIPGHGGMTDRMDCQ